MEENIIIKNLEALTEQFIPGRVIHRDGQLKAIRDCLKPVLNDMPPINAFLHGSPGTGKTCISRYVTGELRANSSILGSYVNCWENPSGFRVIYNILKDFGMELAVHRKGTPQDELLEVLKKKLEGNRAVIILDEVDRIADDKILYDLSGIRNASLILIANPENAFYRADQRVRSRLASAENIEFLSYGTGEVLEILRDRAEWGLVPGAIRDSQLERIAQASGGDARIAIECLRVLSESAENRGMERIGDSMVGNILKNIVKCNVTERLNPHQKVILELLKSGEMDSGRLFRELQNLSQKRGLEEITDRTFRRYLEGLVRYGRINPSGTGRWRAYSLAD